VFGRKRKKQEESTGLAGLSNANVTPSVTVTPSSSAPAPAPQGITTVGQPQSFTTVSVDRNPQAVLSQILAGHGPLSDLIGQIKADPVGFRDRMIAQAQAAGVSTFVMTPQGMTPLSGAGAQHVDVVDELTKAAELHDKGALTDAEFEALKKKLLGE
jgi:hypothetical protein